ncbi:NAD(P)-dependent dehydrogenase, short-chain alcohol dehydrogenase family [Paenibacillus sophorae]|uniref:NAD(P)-dependent dehydrogenase, short-chain alcohol dehydrogenase family n=1 Tax=Paenibacillus sophorae TaxID=1333845 RepID=A0A1H8KDJ2_9BACL|nr:SDR family oxidoreductase [Paenibacillus sophorae]QWU13697.1 SDR family oxidoreductase [Paenibacillus sophorae]SEN90606.1 NAD(P)-dependent dehydrogenase, short-chain alcohol dehydrogenase family [Paenibacillus sophorae]
MQGKRIIVIGGSSGIGLAAAKRASELGAEVIIAGRSKERLEHAAASLDGEIRTRALDMRSEDDLRTFFAEIGNFDHLVITAGEMKHGLGMVLDLDAASAREQFESRFWGPYLAIRYGAPAIRERGSITLTSGVFGDKAVPGAAVPSAVHGALENLGRVLAAELAPVRVNVVSPGYVDTPMHDGMPPEQKKAWFEQTAATLPVRRIASADDIAGAILFLLENTNTTGITLTVDGGARLV